MFLEKKFGLMKREMPLEGKEISSQLLNQRVGSGNVTVFGDVDDVDFFGFFS